MCFPLLQLHSLFAFISGNNNLDNNSQAVKKGAALFKMASIKKSCEIQAGGQEMAVMVG